MTNVNVDVSIPSDAFELGDVFRDHGDLHISLSQFVPTGGAFVPYFWVETTDPETFERAVRADPRVAGLTALTSESRRTLYRIEWSDTVDGFVEAVAAHDLVVEEATGTGDRWWFRLRGPDHDNLAAFQQTLLDGGIELHIHRVWTPDAAADDPYELTSVQRETLELAYTEGYFKNPRTVTMTELGEMLDVSRQSVSRRLRNGLDNLLRTTLMNETSPEDR